VWSPKEREILAPVLEKVGEKIGPLEGKRILVLCSAAGDVALWLAERMKTGRVVGLELSEDLLETARARAKDLAPRVEFLPAERTRIPFPDASFDALVSEFIVFPSPEPTDIGQPEMARVLRPGGTLVLTDVIAQEAVPDEVKRALAEVGPTYWCEAHANVFRRWMKEADFLEVGVEHLTPSSAGPGPGGACTTPRRRRSRATATSWRRAGSPWAGGFSISSSTARNPAAPPLNPARHM